MSEQVITLEKKDLDALVSKLGDSANEKINDLFSKAEQGSKDALKEVKEMVKEISTIEGKSIGEYSKAMQDHINKLEEAQKAMNQANVKGLGFDELLRKEVQAQLGNIQKSVKERRGSEFELKAVGDTTITDNLGAGVVQHLYLPGITGIPKRRPSIYDLLNKIPWATDTVPYVENSGSEGTIASRVESATSLAGNRDAYSRFPQVDYDFVKRTMILSKIPARAKVSVEMVENADNVVSFIRNELLLDLMLKLDTDILKGDGEATIGTMKGLQHADHYTAAAIPGNYTLPSGIIPTNVHVLRAIITQSLNAYMNPTGIIMHPTDVMEMDLAVDKNGQFLLAPFTGRDNSVVKGVPVYESATLTAGTFHVIDGSKIGLYVQRGLNLRTLDQNGYDAEYDLMTMIASVKAGVLVKNNHKAANIYGNFATLIAAMTASAS
jgi:HK97 family phage major capsid protein